MKIVQKLGLLNEVVEYFKLVLVHVILMPISKVLYRNRHIWLICERGTDARDNGFHLYRYIRENHPGQEIFYIINKNSSDYSKVACLGKAIEPGSLTHWLLYLAAEMKISTHRNGFVPVKNWRYQRFVSQFRPEEPIVFLQHGITKDNIEGLYKKNTAITLFICGAKPEYDYILSKFGYSETEVKYTGFARFDELNDFQIKRQILIMPTWRSWFSTHFDGVTQQNVENSTFLKKWAALIQSKRLRELTQKYNVSFVFYPHYEVQPYIHLFGQTDECVTIADFAHYDVQQLLKESMLLITDFSSVFFDFAYMQKPVLYYQFDEEEYREHHYAQGYFDYRRDGFGEVVTEEADLLVLLEQYLKNSCRLKPEYQQRIQGFFPLHDKKNCERIYQEIKNLS